MNPLNMEPADPSWHPAIKAGLAAMDPTYLAGLAKDPTWLPGPDKLFNAFSLPLTDTRMILFGESPYPRAESATGYAFWDGAVGNIWSETGLAKPVNRATSLRHIIKGLLIAAGELTPETADQPHIAKIDKTKYISTLDELFQNFINHGVLLLNISLVLRDAPVAQDVRYWRPFMHTILETFKTQCPDPKLIIFGRLAETLNKYQDLAGFTSICSEHPYNVSFLKNTPMLTFLDQLNLLHPAS